MGTHSSSEVSSTMLRSAVLLALVSVAVVAAVNVNTDELAQKAIDEALKLGMGMLDSVMTSFHEDAAKVCYWNDWQAPTVAGTAATSRMLLSPLDMPSMHKFLDVL